MCLIHKKETGAHHKDKFFFKMIGVIYLAIVTTPHLCSTKILDLNISHDTSLLCK